VLSGLIYNVYGVFNERVERLKKVFSIILVLNMMLLNFNFSVASAQELSNLTAKSAIVIEAATGKVLYEKDANSKRYPASTTKMMTLIVALEYGKLEDTVIVSKNAVETEGSSLGLDEGEKIKLSDLLYGMMLVSGNDATVAVAEHIAGSVDKFAQLMTKKAIEIGAQNTSFVNSSGLPDPDHYTTASDLAKIAAYGYKNPMFATIVNTKEKLIPWGARAYMRDLNNENRMLSLYDGSNGVKTGYTDIAGRCLVSAAKRDGVQLIAVVLDSEYMWNDSIDLLDYGFRNIQSLNLFKKKDIVKTVHVVSGKKDVIQLVADSDVDIPVADGEKDKFQTLIDVPERIYAPVGKGDPVGKVKIMYNGKEVASANLIAKESVDKRSFFSTVYQTISLAVSYIKNTLV